MTFLFIEGLDCCFAFKSVDHCHNDLSVGSRVLLFDKYQVAIHAKHFYGSFIPAGQEPGNDTNLQLLTREPIGVVVCIIPFNFPCDLYDQKVAPALMMGNAAIVLPSSDNPLTLMKLSEIMDSSTFPLPPALQAR